MRVRASSASGTNDIGMQGERVIYSEVDGNAEKADVSDKSYRQASPRRSGRLPGRPVIRLSACFFTLEARLGNPRSYLNRLVSPRVSRSSYSTSVFPVPFYGGRDF